MYFKHNLQKCSFVTAEAPVLVDFVFLAAEKGEGREGQGRGAKGGDVSSAWKLGVTVILCTI